MTPPLLVLDLASPLPPYEQIATQVRRLVAGGQLEQGTALPSVRQLARDLGVAPNTVMRAYSELQRDGWIAVRNRRGAVVASPDRLSSSTDRRRQLADAVGRLLEIAHQVRAGRADLHAEIDRQLGASSTQRH